MDSTPEVSCRKLEMEEKRVQIPCTNSNSSAMKEKDEQATFIRLIIWALCTVGFCNAVPVYLSQFYFRIPSAAMLWFPEKLYSPGANVPIFYQNAGFEGWSVIGWSSFKCVNLPVEAFGVSSVHTRGNCILLYDKAQCQGKSLTLVPGGKFHNDLSRLEFDDVTRSIGPCF